MLTINRLKMSIAESRELEMTKANIAKQQAEMDYIAMMCDIDIPVEEEVNELGGIEDVRED